MSALQAIPGDLQSAENYSPLAAVMRAVVSQPLVDRHLSDSYTALQPVFIDNGGTADVPVLLSGAAEMRGGNIADMLLPLGNDLTSSRVVADPHAPFDEVFNRHTPFTEVFVVYTGCASQGNLIDNYTHMHELTCFDSSDLDYDVPELVHSDSSDSDSDSDALELISFGSSDPDSDYDLGCRYFRGGIGLSAMHGAMAPSLVHGSTADVDAPIGYNRCAKC